MKAQRLQKKIRKTITTHRMLQPGDKVLVGVSGGPDSVALLHLLAALTPAYDLSLAVAHLNHCLRGADADRDAAFVAGLARRMGLPLYMDKRDVRLYRRQHRLSVETAARRVRYAFLKEVVDGNGLTKIALGHHMDDNAELILMNLLRGSGPTGLGGIPPVRDNRIIRPLIDFTRQEIMAYLAAEKLDYVIDASNTDCRHLRNRIRSELLPLLATDYNPGIVAGLNRTAAVCRAENRWFEEALDPFFDACVDLRTDDTIKLSVTKMAGQHPAVQRRLIRRAFKTISGDLRRLSFGHIETVRGLLTGPAGTRHMDLPHRIRVCRSGNRLVFKRLQQSLRRIPVSDRRPAVTPFAYLCPLPGEVMIPEAGLRLVFSALAAGQFPDRFPAADPAAAHAVYLDLDRLVFPVTIRNRRAGDRFSSLGLGGTQKLGRFLAGREKDHCRRAACPVMVSDNRIVCVIGYGIADDVKIGPDTRRGVKVDVLLAKN